MRGTTTDKKALKLAFGTVSCPLSRIFDQAKTYEVASALYMIRFSLDQKGTNNENSFK
jgi:hypothetical protein